MSRILKLNTPVEVERKRRSPTSTPDSDSHITLQGVVAYLGPVSFSDGDDWVGVRLTGDSVGHGNNNGTIRGVKYFTHCKSRGGMFVRRNAVKIKLQTPTPNGVSVYYLRKIFLPEVMKGGFDESSTIYELENLNKKEHGIIRKAGEMLLCPRDRRMGTAFVDAISKEYVGPATHMLSYGWGYKIGDIIATLEAFCKSEKLDTKTTYIWMCCLCNNQHRLYENKKNGKTICLDEFQATFSSNLKSIKHVIAMMAPWKEPLYLTRLWCIFEMYMASQTDGCQLTISMPPNEMRAAIDDVKNVDVVFNAMDRAHLKSATTSYDQDKKHILRIIKKSIGFSKFNDIINSKIREWFLATVKNVADRRCDTYHDSNDKTLHYATLCQNVGHVLNKYGENNDAMTYFERTLSLRYEILGPEHEKTANICSTIGNALRDMGEYNGALIKYRKALEVRSKLNGEDHPSTAAMRNNIALVLNIKGEYAAARDEYHRVLEARMKINGEVHPRTAQALSNIATAHQNNGEYDAALEEYNRALDIKLKVHGNDHPSIADTRNNIGMVLTKKGEHDAALIEYHKALDVYVKVHGEDNPFTTSVRNNINTALHNKGEHQDVHLLLRTIESWQ